MYMTQTYMYSVHVYTVYMYIHLYMNIYRTCEKAIIGMAIKSHLICFFPVYFNSSINYFSTIRSFLSCFLLTLHTFVAAFPLAFLYDFLLLVCLSVCSDHFFLSCLTSLPWSTFLLLSFFCLFLFSTLCKPLNCYICLAFSFDLQVICGWISKVSIALDIHVHVESTDPDSRPWLTFWSTSF